MYRISTVSLELVRPSLINRAIDDDLLPQRWARLWKLHGSINWELDSSGECKETDQLDRLGKESRLIHPSHLKYTESRRMRILGHDEIACGSFCVSRRQLS